MVISLLPERKSSSWFPGATVELVVDFRCNPPPPPPNINSSVVSIVESLKFLVTTISRDLKWERNTLSITKRAQQRMFFLRQLKKFNLSQSLMILFYTAISIAIWFGSSTSHESRVKWQCEIRTVERIIGCSLLTFQDLYNSRVMKRTRQNYSRPLSSWTSPLAGTSLW